MRTKKERPTKFAKEWMKKSSMSEALMTLAAALGIEALTDFFLGGYTYLIFSIVYFIGGIVMITLTRHYRNKYPNYYKKLNENK